MPKNRGNAPKLMDVHKLTCSPHGVEVDLPRPNKANSVVDRDWRSALSEVDSFPKRIALLRGPSHGPFKSRHSHQPRIGQGTRTVSPRRDRPRSARKSGRRSEER